MKCFLSISFLLLLISLTHAQFDLEKYNPPDNLTTGVKSILRRNTSLDHCGMCYPTLTKFNYDDRNRIEQSTEYGGIDFKDTTRLTKYSYDTNGLLTNKSIFIPKKSIRDSTILLSSIEYGYVNGLLISEIKYFPSKTNKEVVKYIYQDDQLCSLVVYNTGKLIYTYEYQNNRIIRMIPFTDNVVSIFKYHFIYSEDTLTEIRLCNDHGMRRNSVHYSYNKNGKISTVSVSNGGGLGMGPTYDEKYEY